MPQSVGAECLTDVLPPEVARETYDSALECLLSLCESWAVCPRSCTEVMEWMEFYYLVWVHFACVCAKFANHVV